MRAIHRGLPPNTTAGVALGCLMLMSCAADADPSVADPSNQESSPTSPTSTLTASSDIPQTYRFDLTSSCGERGFLGTYRVSVRAGVVQAARPLDPVNSYEPDLAEVPSLQAMIDTAAGLGPPAEVDIRTDPSGVPTYLIIDRLPDAEDDEECYEIANIRPLDR